MWSKKQNLIKYHERNFFSLISCPISWSIFSFIKNIGFDDGKVFCHSLKKFLLKSHFKSNRKRSLRWTEFSSQDLCVAFFQLILILPNIKSTGTDLLSVDVHKKWIVLMERIIDWLSVSVHVLMCTYYSRVTFWDVYVYLFLFFFFFHLCSGTYLCVVRINKGVN